MEQQSDLTQLFQNPSINSFYRLYLIDWIKYFAS